jgi:adenylate kinase family enzyme
MSRVVIIGSPRSGKTTLGHEMADASGARLRHTDDLIGELDWSACSERIASDWFEQPGPWIIEGVAAVRALRKWLAARQAGKPCDTIICLSQPRVALTPGQATMAAGCSKIWGEIRAELRWRDVAIEE